MIQVKRIQFGNLGLLIRTAVLLALLFVLGMMQNFPKVVQHFEDLTENMADHQDGAAPEQGANRENVTKLAADLGRVHKGPDPPGGNANTFALAVAVAAANWEGMEAFYDNFSTRQGEAPNLLPASVQTAARRQAVGRYFVRHNGNEIPSIDRAQVDDRDALCWLALQSLDAELLAQVSETAGDRKAAAYRPLRHEALGLLYEGLRTIERDLGAEQMAAAMTEAHEDTARFLSKNGLMVDPHLLGN